MSAGERLATLAGPTAVLGIQPQHTAGQHKPQTVYNLEVQGQHVFRVTSNGLLVHNAYADEIAKLADDTAKKIFGKAPKAAPKRVFEGIKNATGYPTGFRTRIGNHTTRNTIKNKQLLSELRKIESGAWKKVYKDGFDANSNRISLHYFQGPSGKIFNFKVKPGWSN